ncbi:PAS domain-containing sensor histidine kinase [Candidatus Binatus sp.]|uniref:PAS domain-containing sensor histidine kinase n=1 Tax=Candidatus Binatus sp. TaxID=2811406 RepID=UPI003C99FCC9
MKANLSTSVRLELEELRQRLQEAEETLEAIRSGEVDALVVSGPSGEKVFTLEGAEHPYRVLVESMNEGAISLSLDGTILYCNAAFARLIGCPLDQIMGRDLVEFVPVEEREMLERLIGRGHLDAVRAELTILAAPGRELPTQVSLNPINLEEGPSIAVIVTDLSERKRHQQAEAAVRMRDEFLAIASHELRTPLTTLVLSLGAVEQDRTKGDLKQIQRSLRRAQKQAERMGHLLDRMLDVSQMAAGKLKLDLAPCDLSDVVRDIVERLSEDASNAACELRLTLSGGIVGKWDRFRLDEAFSNIISNAIKYGAGHPIDIQLQASDENAVLVVEDHGIGIAPDDLSRIFGRFERTVASKNYGGLGLGLYIARQIIEQHRGSIRAENRPCGGARFVIKVPLVSSTETILKN